MSRAAFVLALAPAVVLAVVLAPHPALAHRIPVRRTMFLEPAGARDLHVIVAIRVPSGPARRALNLMADLDRNGSFSDVELAEVRHVLALRALDGLRIYAGTTTIAVENLNSKEKVAPGEGTLELMLHGVAILPNDGRDVFAVTTSVSGDPLDLVVLPGDRPVVDASRGRVVRGGLKTVLGLGDRVSWHAP